MRGRLDESSYYGIPQRVDFDGTKKGTQELCTTEDQFREVTDCVPMTKVYYLQYQVRTITNPRFISRSHFRSWSHLFWKVAPIDWAMSVDGIIFVKRLWSLVRRSETSDNGFIQSLQDDIRIRFECWDGFYQLLVVNTDGEFFQALRNYLKSKI